MHHHGAGLRRALAGEGVSPEAQDRILAALAAGETPPSSAAADRAMLAYVRKLTVSPAAMRAADVDALRRAGFDDRGIHDICAIASYYAFVNRIADGLGVDLEA